MNKQNVDIKLKPYPCCGGKARLKQAKYNALGSYGDAELDKHWYGIYCTQCGLSQPRRQYFSKKAAYEVWNRRV